MSVRDRVLTLGEAVWRAVPTRGRVAFLRATQDTWLVGVVGLITNPKGHVLLLEHRYRVPWRWGLPGGHVQVGEAFDRGLEREIFEETGLSISARNEIIDFELARKWGGLTVTLVGTCADAEIVPTSSEIVRGGFFPPDALPAGMDRYQGNIVKRYFSGHGGTVEIGERGRPSPPSGDDTQGV